MQNEDIYFIPVNFTDAGRVLGLFELRNCIEAAVLALPTFGLCSLIAHYTPFSVTVKLILSLCLLVPVCGFDLIGIRDESLSRFLCTYVRWRRCRRIAINKGGSIKRGHQKNHLRGSSERNRNHCARK
nr:hypothetical protein [uncultured Agathobaculum sp.]